MHLTHVMCISHLQRVKELPAWLVASPHFDVSGKQCIRDEVARLTNQRAILSVRNAAFFRVGTSSSAFRFGMRIL